MRYRSAAAALLMTSLTLAGSLGYAADPVFKAALVTESRVYEREKGSIAIGGIRAQAATEWTSRVTVALDGERVTGEWVPKTTISATAKDFRRGSDVEAATTRNQLLLKLPDGSVVTAKIVRRATPEGDDDARD
jgi:hypothetical protein